MFLCKYVHQPLIALSSNRWFFLKRSAGVTRLPKAHSKRFIVATANSNGRRDVVSDAILFCAFIRAGDGCEVMVMARFQGV